MIVPLDGRTVFLHGLTDRSPETVAALVEANARVLIAAREANPQMRDLASRGMVTLVAEPDPLAYDMVLRDPQTAPAPGTATAQSGRGRVTLVGGGPGSPDLLTLGGMRALREADVVVTDRLAPTAVLTDLPDHVEVIHVGKIPRGAFTPQEDIDALLVEKALAGHHVVRLKGGDNFVFGRGGEEWNACVDAGVPVDVIPGVSSSIAAPALAGIPLTHRTLTQGFTVVSAHVPPGDPRSTLDWAALAKVNTTLVILMGVATLPAVAHELITHGMRADTPAAAIADAGLATQRLVRSSVAGLSQDMARGGITAPAVIVVGDVVEALEHPC